MSIRRKLDPASGIPIHEQLKEILRAEILEGHLRPGDRLPTEAELCARYGVSRAPVRQALEDLAREGLIVRQRGRGTFVAVRNGRGGPPVVLRVILSHPRWRIPLDQAVSRWNAEHPDRPLELTVQEIPFLRLRQTLIEAVGNGEAPDLSILDSAWLAEFVALRYLRAIGEIDPVWEAQAIAWLMPGLRMAYVLEGHLYAIPISMDVSVLWVRRDWLMAEGLHPPTSWEDLLRVGLHFRRSEIRRRYGLGPYPLAMVAGRAGGETTTYQTLPFLWANGGELVANGQVLLDQPATRETLAFLRSLIWEHGLMPPEVVAFYREQAAQWLGEGRVVMAVGGTYEAELIRQITGWDEAAFLERMAAVPIPAGPHGRPAGLLGGMAFGIYRQSRHPELALALLRLAVEGEALIPFARTTARHPPWIPAASRLAGEPQGFLARTLPWVEQGRPRPPLTNYARVSEEWQALVEDVLARRRPLEAAIRRAAERIAALTGWMLPEDLPTSAKGG
ncbi:putative HTH-type transcriptional regulator YurK [Candidatus Thermoflexus japonica]|uniref:Putative HTH-type transcriptional regulator YurK n=1 Tax=Candidatus Thermoflexus japonica TaxID=2035417 RepID=A0A2H5Y890_9CHLR|nr:putative HTH-type transcriptional regulator YurK [Candidatus Thermoflexus japonica]